MFIVQCSQATKAKALSKRKRGIGVRFFRNALQIQCKQYF